MVSAKQQDDIVRIYSDYRTNLKPLVAEIEALKQAFPTAILNELRSCFDHIARCYSEGNGVPDERVLAINRNIDLASGHLKRAQLDCFKILIVYFDDKVSEFRRANKNKDWSTVDGGRFNSQFHDLYGKAQVLFTESKTVPDSVENWENTCLAYRQLVRFIHDPQNVQKVDEGKKLQTWKISLFWCLLSAVIGYLLGWIKF